MRRYGGSRSPESITILAKFRDVIKNEFIPQEDRNTAAKVLPVLALIQPFELTTQFYELIKGITHCEQQQVDRLLKALKSGGIVIGGSTQHRLAPDLLADFIIETNCISSDGRPTALAKQLLEASSELYIEHILTNLGRFDWRRTQDDTDGTTYPILKSIWADLTNSKEDKSNYLKAIESVAFYQPQQALRFVQESIRRGLYLPKLPEILHDIGYQSKHLADVCKLFWLCVGTPSSKKAAIQVLTKLAALEVNKSVEINIEIADFAIQLMDRKDAWENEFTPLDILSPMLETMTSVHRFRGNTVTWTEHLINPSALKALRERIVDRALLLIGDDDPRVATEAATLLSKALRYPIKDRSLWSDWTPEFIQTMGKMMKRLNMSSLFPLVYHQLSDVLTWHTELNKDSDARMLAAQILSLIPDDLQTKVVLMLYRGTIVHLGRSVSYEERESAREHELTAVCSQLLAEYPNAEDLRIYLSEVLSQIEKSKRNRSGTPHILFSRLFKESGELAEVTIERALQSSKHHTNQFSGYALATLLQHNYEYGMQYVHQIMIGTDEVLHGAIGYAYSICWKNGTEIRTRDVLIVQRLLSSSDVSVLRNATYAITAIADRDVQAALELMLSMSTDHMDLALEVLQSVRGMSVESLGSANTMKLLERLRGTPRLRGYGIEEFISDASLQYPEEVMKFFMGRVEQVSDDFREEPCDHAMLPTLQLQTREANNVHTLLGDFYAWMNTFSHDTPQYYWSIQLFVNLFGPIDDLVIGHLERWCQEASAAQMLMLSKVLNEAHGNFVFQYQSFVKLFLSCAMHHGQEVLDNAVGSLTHSATSGVRSRTRGEPSSRDVANKEQAEAILESVNRHAPEYDVYRLIRDHGMEAIEWARTEKIELERSAEEGEDE